MPGRAQCLKLLEKYSVPENMVRHALAVEKAAVFLAKKISESGEKVDAALVSRGALLHDIGKPESLRTGVSHGEKGREILLAEGFPQAVAEIARTHALYIVMEKTPFRSVEEKIVFLADKRVNHDKIVPLDERFKYLLERYGSTKEKFDSISACREKVGELEKELLKSAKSRKEFDELE